MTMLDTPTRDQRKEPDDRTIRFEVVGDVAAFRAMESEWRELYAACGNTALPLQGFSFLDRWIDLYLSPDSHLAIVIARSGKKLVFALPLMLRRRFGVNVLGFMGLPVAQYCDALLRPDAAPEVAIDLPALARSLEADIFVLPKIGAGSALDRLGIDGAVAINRQSAPLADLRVRVTDGEPGHAYSAKARSNYRRWMRQMAPSGAALFASAPRGADAVAAAVQAIRLKRRWLERNAIVSPAVCDPRFEAFFAAMAAETDEDALKITALSIEGRKVGIDLSFDSPHRAFGHVLALDADAANGAGHVLIHASLAAARKRGRTHFDLNAPADPFKMQHADSLTAVTTYAFALTARGSLYRTAMLQCAAPLAKTIVRGLPKPLSRALISRLSR